MDYPKTRKAYISELKKYAFSIAAMLQEAEEHNIPNLGELSADIEGDASRITHLCEWYDRIGYQTLPWKNEE